MLSSERRMRLFCVQNVYHRMRRKAAGEKRCWCGRARYTPEWRKICVLMAKNHNSRVIVLHWNHILSFCREISHCDSHDSTVSASSISTRCCTFLCYFVSISAKSVIRIYTQMKGFGSVHKCEERKRTGAISRNSHTNARIWRDFFSAFWKFRMLKIRLG